jgi:hypothetical protein
MTWHREQHPLADVAELEVVGALPPELDGLLVVPEPCLEPSDQPRACGVRISFGAARWCRSMPLQGLAATLGSLDLASYTLLSLGSERSLARVAQDGLYVHTLASDWQQLTRCTRPLGARYAARIADSQLQWRALDAQGTTLSAGTLSLPSDAQVFDVALDESHLAALVSEPSPRGDTTFRIGTTSHPKSGELTWVGRIRAHSAAILNSYCDQSTITIDVAVRASKGERTCEVERFWLGTSDGSGSSTRLSLGKLSWPSVHNVRRGAPHHFIYALEWRDDVGEPMLVRVDVNSKERMYLPQGFGKRLGGPALAPNLRKPNSEQHGYVLALLYDAVRDSSELLVLATDDWRRGPIATVRLPSGVRSPLPGMWLASRL